MANPTDKKKPAEVPKMFGTSETARLVVLGLGAIVILFVILGPIMNSEKPSKSEDEDAEAAFETPSAKTLVFRNPDGTTTKVSLEDDEGAEFKQEKVLPFELNPKILDQVVDYTSMEFDKEPFYYAIHKVAATPPADIQRDSDRKTNYTDLIRYSSRLRGTYIRVQGSLLYLKRNLLPENRSGLRHTYLGGIVGSNRKPYTFLCFEVPPRVAMRDVVELHGFFYKFWRYDNRSGHPIESPYFIARTFRKIPAVPPQKPIHIFGVDLTIGNHVLTWWELTVMALLLIFVPGLFFLVRHERRKGVASEKMLIEKRRQRRGALPGKAGDPAVSPGSSPPETSAGAAPPPEEGASGSGDEAQPGPEGAQPPDPSPPDSGA
jgi:hypothetical protein